MREILRELRPGRGVLAVLRSPATALAGAALSATLCGAFLHPHGFAVAAAIGMVLAGGLIWPWLSVVGVAGRLEFDRTRGREGEPMVLRLAIRNRFPWGAFGLRVVEEGGTPLATVGDLPGWSSDTLSVEFVPECRGVYPRGRLCVRSGFPFGLWEASRPIAESGQVVVWPRTFPVAELPDHRGDGGHSGQSTRDRPGNWGEPMGVRAYRRGDPLRRVHWGLSARHGELIVTEVQSSCVPRVRVVLDLDPSVHRGTGPDGSFEWAIRAAGSLAEGWARDGAEVSLVLGPRTVVGRGGSVNVNIAAYLDALARVGPLAGDPPAPARDRAGLEILVTTDLREGRDAPLVVRLRAEGFAGGSELHSPDLAGWMVIDGPESAPSALRGDAKRRAVADAAG